METRIESAAQWLPAKLVCRIDRQRGPVRLEATFPSGTLAYSLVSFEPGLALAESLER